MIYLSFSRRFLLSKSIAKTPKKPRYNITNFIIIVLFPLISFVSCDGNHKDVQNHPNADTSPALQENNLGMKSYIRDGGLSEELYQELVEKSPALKKLEQDIESIESKHSELKAKFQQFNNKSNSYYSSANSGASAIKDSLLKMKIIGLIKKSNDRYTKNTAELNSLLKHISDNETRIEDHHSALKIILTLPIIENYQKFNKLSNKEFKDFLKVQRDLISRTDSLTPSY